MLPFFSYVKEPNNNMADICPMVSELICNALRLGSFNMFISYKKGADAFCIQMSDSYFRDMKVPH